MNRYRLAKQIEQHQIRHRQTPLIGQRNWTDSGGNPVSTIPSTKWFAAKIALVSGDPNSNGGRDADGNYVAYFISPSQDESDMQPCRIAPDTNEFFSDGDKVWGYSHGTVNSAGYAVLRVIGGPVEAVLIETGGSGYPSTSSGADIFPAHVQTGASFDDSTVTNTLTSSDGAECRVLNLLGDYIPTGTLLLALPIYGQATSHKAHYVVEYRYEVAEDIDFHLTGTLNTTDATASSFSVDSYNNGSQPGGTITLANMAGASNYIFSGASGAKGWATLVSYTASNGNATYKIRQMNC